MKLYCVVDPELGWDSILGIFDNRAAAEECLKNRGGDAILIDWHSLNPKLGE